MNQAVEFWILQIIFIAVVIRMTAYAIGGRERFFVAPVLLAGFLLLGLVQHLAGIKSPWLINVYLAAQSAIVFSLLLTPPRHDFYAMLYLGLGLVVTKFLPPRAFIPWLCGMCVLMSAGLFIAFGLGEGVTYAPSYVAGVLFIGLYGRANRKAEEAMCRSEELRSRLEEANRRLQAFAVRAEEEATAQERARLARELHDAVTQTVFSMNLTAEAARTAMKKRPALVPGLLKRLQEMAKDALSEMRSMVQQLRPREVADSGLVASLERHLALRLRRDGLKTAFHVHGTEKGPVPALEALYRTAQEALNNVVRHSGVNEASVDLTFGEGKATLLVRDKGRGFDPAAPRPGECFGLSTMRERAEARGGGLRISSATGTGTEIEITVPINGEAE